MEPGRGCLQGGARKRGATHTFAVLSDGRLVSGGSWDGAIKLWNLTSGSCEATLRAQRYGVTTLAALGDGRLASGTDNYTIELWNPTSSTCEVTLTPPRQAPASCGSRQSRTLHSWEYSPARIILWIYATKPMPLSSAALETPLPVPGHNGDSATGVHLGLPSCSRV